MRWPARDTARAKPYYICCNNKSRNSVDMPGRSKVIRADKAVLSTR